LVIDFEFVPLGLTAEYWMIVQNQAGSIWLTLALKEERGRQAADAAADHHTIEFFACIDSLCGCPVERMIANFMTFGHHLIGVAVGARIIAHAAVSGPIFFSEKLEWRYGA
jgi:hypothetical protein